MFPAAVSAGNKTRARTSGYWSRTIACVNDNEVLFRAQSALDYLDTPLLEIEYENVDIGAFGDVVPGMVVLISATTNPRDAKYRGRVADDLTADTLPISQNATLVNAGDYLMVIADAELASVNRIGDLKDGRFAWTNLPPMISGLPGCIVLYDSDDDDEVLWTPSQTGIPVEDGSAIDTWAWTVSGGGTSTVSDDEVEHPDFTFEAGYHYLVSVVVTDDNGTQHRQFVHVYAVTRTLDAPVIKPIVTGSIDSDLTNGFSVSVTAFGGVSGLVDRSHVAIAKIERWGDNTSAAVLTNLRFTGRLRSESIRTAGSAEAGREMQVSFSAESITSYMSRLSCPNDIVRHKANPATFGEITDPSVYRKLVYYLSTYTTLLSLGSFTAGDDETLAWLAGGEPVGIDGGNVQDVMKTVCERIKAGVNYSPDGSIHIEQLASYKQDRSGVVTVMDFSHASGDIREYELDRDTSRTTSQVIATGGAYNSATNRFVLFGASAPSIPYGEGETRELTRELLTADATTEAAAEELESRAGNDFAYNNSKALLRLTLRGCWNWLFATGYQRYTATLPATSNTRGIAYAASDFWQLQSVSVQINTDGTDDVTAELVEETEFTDTQSMSNLLPDNLPQLNPNYPVLSDYPAEPDNPLWGLPTDTPAPEELPTTDPYTGYLSFGTMTPDQAAQAGRQQPEPGCFVTQVNMRNSGTTLGDTTVNTDPYIMQTSGFGQISAAGWAETGINFTPTDQGFIPVISVATPVAVHTPPWTRVYNANAVGISETRIEQTFADTTTWLTVRARITCTSPTARLYVRSSGAAEGDVSVGIATNEWFQVNVNYTEDYLRIDLAPADIGDVGDFVMTIHEIEATGTGINPFTSMPGAAAVFADSWYFWDEGDEEGAQVFAATAGMLIDGAKPAVIPDYRNDHVYAGIEYTGTGNPLQLAFALSDYTGTDSKLITVVTCQNP